MSLTELLLQAKVKKAEDVIFVVGSEPRIRTVSGWMTLRNSPALMTEWGLLQQTLLSSAQMTALEQKGVVKGESSIENYRIGFSFYQDEYTMKAHLEMDLDGQSQDISLPSSLLDSTLRLQGLTLISGPGETGQVWALHRLLQKIGEEKAGMGVVFSRSPFPQLREEKMCYLYHDGAFKNPEEESHLLAGANVLVYHGFDDEASIAKAIAMAEQGYFVIYSMKAPSLLNSLRRCLTAVEGSQHGAGRLAEVLNVAAGHYSLRSQTAEKIFAHEILPMKPQVRQMLEKQDLKGIEEVMNQAQESSGILTLNQSLLQHLIRRKIDLKTAFEVSKNPDGLDQLLKKVGI